MQPTGRARVEGKIVDLSSIVNTASSGIIALMGATERGEVGKSRVVGSVDEFKANFGDLLEDSDFPLYCIRVLERGGVIRVARAGHYTDAEDLATLVGAKSTISVATTPNIIDVEAASIGSWGDDITVKVLDAASGDANKRDIKVSLAGSPNLDKTIFEINSTLTQDDIDKFNAQSDLAKFADTAAVGGELGASADYALAGGSYDATTVVTADYEGNLTAGTGIHSFDKDTDFFKIAIPHMADPDIDDLLIGYCETRQDCRAILRTPISISGATAVEYRQRIDTYAGGDPIDSLYGDMYYGTLVIQNPTGVGEKRISVIGDVIGAISAKSADYPSWISVAGKERGGLGKNLGITYNLASPARTAEFDKVDSAGINAIVDDRDYGITIWGNGSLSKDDTLFKFTNVCDLVIFLFRVIPPLAKKSLFEPNDIETWKTIYRSIEPYLRSIKDQRGVWDFLYQGDQFVDSIDDIQINDSGNIDAGKYIFNIWIKPKVALKYIGFSVTTTNSGASFKVLK